MVLVADPAPAVQAQLQFRRMQLQPLLLVRLRSRELQTPPSQPFQVVVCHRGTLHRHWRTQLDYGQVSRADRVSSRGSNSSVTGRRLRLQLRSDSRCRRLEQQANALVQ